MQCEDGSGGGGGRSRGREQEQGAGAVPPKSRSMSGAGGDKIHPVRCARRRLGPPPRALSPGSRPTATLCLLHCSAAAHRSHSANFVGCSFPKTDKLWSCTSQTAKKSSKANSSHDTAHDEWQRNGHQAANQPAHDIFGIQPDSDILRHPDTYPRRQLPHTPPFLVLHEHPRH